MYSRLNRSITMFYHVNGRKFRTQHMKTVSSISTIILYIQAINTLLQQKNKPKKHGYSNQQTIIIIKDLIYLPVGLFTKILTIKNCRKFKTKIKENFAKILTIILSVKIVLTLHVKLPCSKCKILIVREILVLSFIVSEKNRKKDGRCIGAST